MAIEDKGSSVSIVNINNSLSIVFVINLRVIENEELTKEPWHTQNDITLEWSTNVSPLGGGVQRGLTNNVQLGVAAVDLSKVLSRGDG